MSEETSRDRLRTAFSKTIAEHVLARAEEVGIAGDVQFYPTDGLEDSELGAGVIFNAGSNHDNPTAMHLSFRCELLNYFTKKGIRDNEPEIVAITYEDLDGKPTHYFSIAEAKSELLAAVELQGAKIPASLKITTS